MIINVSSLKSLLNKATLNNSIDSVQLKFTEDGLVTTSMISTNKDAVAKLKVENDVIKGIKDEVELNFMSPNKELIPFITLLNEDEIEAKISDEKMVIQSGKQKINIHFCSPQVVSVFSGSMDNTIKPIHNIKLTEDFVDSFKKIKKVGSKFDNIYFTIEDNVMYLESTDKKNKYSNGLKTLIDEGVKHKDVSIAFNYKNFLNLISVISNDIDSFTMDIYYMEKQKAGLLKVTNGEEEMYVLMSIISEDIS